MDFRNVFKNVISISVFVFFNLQLLYRQLNGEAASALKTTCPFCGAVSEVQLSGLYDDMGIYQKEV